MDVFNNTTVAPVNVTLPLASTTQPFVVAVAWFTVVSCTLSLSGNGLVLFLYLKTRSLRTSFNIYIANLACAELLFGLTSLPVQFVNQYYEYWPYSFGLCSFLDGTSTIAGAAIRLAHLLMTFNRLWAITEPVSYNQIHTWKVALFFIILSWCLVSGLYVPITYAGRLHMKPDEKLCTINVSFQFTSLIAARVVVYDFPLVAHIVCFPIISFLLYRRSGKKNFNRENDVSMNTGAGDSMSVSNKVTPNQLGAAPARRKKPSSGSNTLFVYVSIAITVCWITSSTFWVMADHTGYWDDTYYGIQACTTYTNSWINPVLCFLAMEKFRIALKATCSC